MNNESPTLMPTEVGVKPELCLAVGVTGHRLKRLQDADIADPQAIQATVTDLLRRITEAARSVAAQHAHNFASTLPHMRMVSPLADGADTIAAEAALSAGWQLEACLPFDSEDYAIDFTIGESRERFAALLARASATFTLVGTRADAEAAYEAAGRVMLDQVDVLLALWDGDVGRGRGGTARVVAEAISRHIPVIHIDIYAKAEPVVLWSGLADFEIEQPTIDNIPRVSASTALAPIVSALTIPPENPIDRRMLARFYHERARARTPALPYPMLLAMTGTRPLAWSDLQPATAASCAQSLATQLQRVAHAGVYGQALMSKLVARFGIADSAAGYFAQIFRSGFVANFGLAAIAVLLALSGPLAPAYKLPLILTELGVILIIFINTSAGTRAGWHERWMDDRHLAEQLRSLAMTSVLGNLNLRASSGRDAAALPGWVNWLGRATARELGLPHARVDQAYLANVRDTAEIIITDQIAYHRTNAHRMHKLESRLHAAGQFLFGGTMVACVAWIGAKLMQVPMSFGGSIGLTEIVTALTAAMPAMGAALYGIGMQGDFVGIAHRSEATVARLERLKRALKDDPLEYARLIARLRRLADIMLTDVAHWRTTYQARPLKLPG